MTLPKSIDSDRPKQASIWLLIGIICLCLFLGKTPVFNVILYPVGRFITALHELSHAIACLSTGGKVTGLTIVSDNQGHGGLTMCRGGIAVIIVQAGYMGTALWGCILIAISKYQSACKTILIVLGICLLAASLLLMTRTIVLESRFVQAFMSVIWGLLIALALILSGWKLKPSLAQLMLLFLAVQTSLNALTDVAVLIQQSFGIANNTTFSDATNMEDFTQIPAIVWSLVWGVISFVMLGISLWWSYR